MTNQKRYRYCSERTKQLETGGIVNVDHMTIAAIALEQITLLKAQNARLIELNARHVQQLEQLCTERDAARAQLKALGDKK